MISRATKGMRDLIDDLLAFSRVGKSEIKKALVNLNEWSKKQWTIIRATRKSGKSSGISIRSQQ
jgi:hypothetical protein